MVIYGNQVSKKIEWASWALIKFLGVLPGHLPDTGVYLKFLSVFENVK